MDAIVEVETLQEPSSLLSYDENVAYEDQLSTNPSEEADLASRIGKTKVYLLSESTVGKRKRGEEVQEVDAPAEMDDVDMAEDPTQRSNALLVQGSPISHLPTARLFAYATHFDAHPLGLEWIDDNTCIFVFETKALAHTSFRYLQKSDGEEPDLEGFVTAKPIPMTFWPPEERINKSLGKGEGLKGVIRMRWARLDDVKKKGAKHESEFYRKHGNMAGKELFNGRETQGAAKRQKTDDPVDLELQRKKLDRELDDFLDSKDDEELEEPPSKMRSDYIAADGRTLLERTSTMRLHSDTLEVDLASRITTHRTISPLPRRARRNLEDRLWSEETVNSVNEKGKNRKDPHGGGRARPRKTQQELDDELDAFLREKD